MALVGKKHHVSIFIKIVIFCIFVTTLTVDYISQGVSAESLWLSGTPTADLKLRPSDSSMTSLLKGCHMSQRSIVGMAGVQNICVVAGKNLTLGVMNGNTRRYAVVSIGEEQRMHVISNLYMDSDTAFSLAPTTDTLTYFKRKGTSTQYEMYAYKDSISRLSVHYGTTVSTTLEMEYNFDFSSSDFHLTNHNNGAALGIDIYSPGYSSNGRFVVVSTFDYGLVRINLDTFEQKAFSKVHRSTYDSSDHYLAVTNGGNNVAIAGRNVTYRVYEVDGSCGNEHVEDLLTSQVCGSVDFTSQAESAMGVSDVNYILFKKIFFIDDDTLQFAVSGTGNTKLVTVIAHGYNVPQLDYLALGDSYSSGEGDTQISPITNKKYYRDHTDVEEDQVASIPREKCHVSTRSYPYHLARSMELAIDSPKEWDTVACSGAETVDVDGVTPVNYQGQDKGDGTPRLLGYSNAVDLQTEALNEFIPGRVEQIEFVKKYRPKVITLTMGGNDIGFGDIMRVCAGLDTCPYAQDKLPELGKRIEAQYLNLRSLYTDLYEASGGAKIYVVGYPQFINSDGGTVTTCEPNASTLNVYERTMIHGGIQYMNDVIEAAAKSVGVKYVDIEDSFSGHRLCDGGDKYVTGIAAWGRSENQESFHPNAQGNAVMASAIFNELNDESLEDYSWCSSGYSLCPDTTIVGVPSIPSYFGVNESTPNSVHANVTLGDQVKNIAMHIITGLYSLAPGSTANVSIHSDPTDLGNYTVGQDGQLDQSITLPQDLEVGYHTLTVSGQTYSGEPIELTQTILIKGSDPNDIDDDGVNDSVDKCMFIPAANIDADYDGVDDACDSEITDPVLYVARNGDATRGEDQDKLYVYRNTLASSLTGVTSDYVDTSIDSNNHLALVGSSQDEATSGVFSKMIMLQDDNNPNAEIPTILMIKHDDQTDTDICTALQPADYLSPALDPTDPNYQSRGLVQLASLPTGVSCEE